jgi:hypothetical protein
VNFPKVTIPVGKSGHPGTVMLGAEGKEVNGLTGVNATRAKRYTLPVTMWLTGVRVVLRGARGAHRVWGPGETMARRGERRREELQMLARAKGRRG